MSLIYESPRQYASPTSSSILIHFLLHRISRPMRKPQAINISRTIALCNPKQQAAAPTQVSCGSVSSICLLPNAARYPRIKTLEALVVEPTQSMSNQPSDLLNRCSTQPQCEYECRHLYRRAPPARHLRRRAAPSVLHQVANDTFPVCRILTENASLRRSC